VAYERVKPTYIRMYNTETKKKPVGLTSAVKTRKLVSYSVFPPFFDSDFVFVDSINGHT